MHQRWLLRAFVLINCLFELALLTLYVYKYHGLIYLDKLSNRTWSKSEQTFMLAFSTVAIFNVSSLIFGLYTLSKHSRGLHVCFQIFLVFSIICETAVCAFKLSNLVILIPRFMLLIYEVFVTQKLLHKALAIDYDKSTA